MRIGVDATALYGRYGGVQYALWNLLFALSRQDNEHQYVVYIPADGPPSALRQRFFNECWQWRILPFKGHERFRRITWQQTLLPLALKKDICDLLYAPTYVAPVFAQIPVVLTAFDLIALEFPQFVTASNRLHYQMLLPLSLRRATRIAVPSDAVRKKIGERFGAKVLLKTRTVPLGLEPLFFQPVSDDQIVAVRKRYELPQKYFLSVGNLEPKKNRDGLIAAYNLLAQRRGNLPALVLAGGTRPWKKLHLPLPENSREIGYVRRRDLPALYAGSAGLIFPTLAEGFGLPVLEALACGTPVVTSPAVPLPGLENVAQIIHPHQPEEIARVMEHLLENPALTAHARLEGPRFAAPYTWKRAAADMLETFTAAARAPHA